MRGEEEGLSMSTVASQSYMFPMQTDIASSVISQMKERHKDIPKLTYMVRGS